MANIQICCTSGLFDLLGFIFNKRHQQQEQYCVIQRREQKADRGRLVLESYNNMKDFLFIATREKT